MARLTLDEAMILQDRFEDFIQSQVGEDIIIHRDVDRFTVEVLRKHSRLPQSRSQNHEIRELANT